MVFNTATMKELFQEFSTSLCAKLDEIHQQVIGLNTRIHDIEQAQIQGGHIMDEHARLNHEAAMEELVVETRCIMIATGRSYL
jgi:hypothetical protein